jgi:hypothetical protein
MRIERRGRAPDPHEGIVHGFLRQILPEQDAAGDADHLRGFAVVDHLQSRPVAGGASRQRSRQLCLARVVEARFVAPGLGDGAIPSHVHALAWSVYLCRTQLDAPK